MRIVDRAIDTMCASVRQRYFVAVIMMCGHMLNTANVISVNILSRSMFYNDRHFGQEYQHDIVCEDTRLDNIKSSGNEEFVWLPDQVELVSMASEIGYLLGRFPLGLLLDKVGGKTIFGYSVFVPAILSIVLPICARISPALMIGNRLLVGVSSSAQYPAMAWFAARWFPLRQTGMMLALMFVGVPIGHMFAICTKNVALSLFSSWASVFYVNGIVAVVWAYLWQALIWEDPFDHPYITVRELEMLAEKVPMYANDSELEPGWKWPWKAIFTSKSVWLIGVVDVGFLSVLNFTTGIIVFKYFPEVHGYDESQHGNVSAFEYLLMALAILSSGYVSDMLIKARWFNTTHVIKICYTICNIIGSLLLVGLTYSGCYLTTAKLYYMAVMTLIGVAYINYAHGILSLAPNYVGTLMVVSTLVPGFVSPALAIVERNLISNYARGTLQTCAILNAVISILTTAIFLKWGRCQLEPWNDPQHKKVREIDYESETSSTTTLGPRAEVGRGDQGKKPTGKDPLATQGSNLGNSKEGSVKLTQSKPIIGKSRSRIDKPQIENVIEPKTALSPNVARIKSKHSLVSKSRNKFPFDKTISKNPYESRNPQVYRTGLEEVALQPSASRPYLTESYSELSDYESDVTIESVPKRNRPTNETRSNARRM